jgi:hypothetical protein
MESLFFGMRRAGTILFGLLRDKRYRGFLLTDRHGERGLFTQSELPCAPDIGRVRIRRTDDTARLDSGVDGFGKTAVFDDSHRLTGEIGKVLSFPGLLNSAAIHAENAVIVILFDDLLDIDVGIKPESEGLNESRNPSLRWEPEPFFDTLGLDDRKIFPGFLIQFDSGLCTVSVFHCPEPKAVMGQPVLGCVLEELDQFFF